MQSLIHHPEEYPIKVEVVIQTDYEKAHRKKSLRCQQEASGFRHSCSNNDVM